MLHYLNNNQVVHGICVIIIIIIIIHIMFLSIRRKEQKRSAVYCVAIRDKELQKMRRQ